MLLFLILLAVAAGGLSGCSESDSIRDYVVKKPPAPGSLWFFKVVGPEAAVASTAGPLKAFVESVTFDPGTGVPTWKLPAGWREESSGEGVRFRTIRIEGETPLELAVTQIAGRVPPSDAEIETQADLLREQVGRAASTSPAVSEAATPATAVETFSAGPYTARLFDFSGETPRFGKTRLVTAMVPVPLPPRAAAASTAPSGRPDKLPFTFTTPAEWREAPQTQFSVVSLATGPEGKTAAMTITPAIGGLFANVNRWRGQAGLAAVEEDQLEDHLQTVDAAGTTILAAEAIGESRAILGGVLKTGADLWFIKLDGPPETVTGERVRFRAFLESIRVE